MPLPIPFYLRNSQTTPLTHLQLDGNLTILSDKIDNTTAVNVGTGVGIFQDKEVSANGGSLNLYSLSGTNGINIGISGQTVVIDGNNAGGGGSSVNYWTAGTGVRAVKLIENFSEASGDYSVVGGSGNTANGTGSLVVGVGNYSSGDTSFVGGGIGKGVHVGNNVTGTTNFVFGIGNFVTGLRNVVLGSGLDVDISNKVLANSTFVLGGNNTIYDNGFAGTTTNESLINGLAHTVSGPMSHSVIFNSSNNIGGMETGEEGGVDSVTGVLLAGINNSMTGKTTACAILTGQNNRIVPVRGGSEFGTTSVINSAIIAGAQNQIGFPTLPPVGIQSTSILSGSKMSGMTTDTAYANKLQATTKVRVSTYDYLITNNLENTDSPTIHNVVHDTDSIAAIAVGAGGGEIVRYGLCGEEWPFTAGQIVYLENDGCWKQTNVATSGVTDGKMLGFALDNSTVSGGEPGKGKGILIRGHARLAELPPSALPGDPLYLDASTTGTLTKTPPSTSGNIVRAVGHLVGGSGLGTADDAYIFFNPDITYLQVS